MIEELYGIEKVEEILMHHSYVGVNLEQICPLIAHGGQRYQQPSAHRPLPIIHPPGGPSTHASTTSTSTNPTISINQKVIPEMSEIDQRVIDVLSAAEMPTETADSQITTTTEKASTKKKDKKDEKEG